MNHKKMLIGVVFAKQMPSESVEIFKLRKNNTKEFSQNHKR